MVMGKVKKHIVEVVFEKGTYNTVCSCHWSGKYKTRSLAHSAGHLHISESFGANATGV